MPKIAPKKPVEVEAVSEVQPSGEEVTFSVKLDNKKYPGRTEQQAISLFLGSIGVTNRVTIEREVK